MIFPFEEKQIMLNGKLQMANLKDLLHDHEETSFTTLLCHSFVCPGTILQSTHSK